MTTPPKPGESEPLVGYMILEDYCEDMSHWSGMITGPTNPAGANLAWENPIKMIEHCAYDSQVLATQNLTKENAELRAKYDELISYLPNVPGEPYEKAMAKEIVELRAEVEKYLRIEANTKEAHASLRSRQTPRCYHSDELLAWWEDNMVICWECEWQKSDAQLTKERARSERFRDKMQTLFEIALSYQNRCSGGIAGQAFTQFVCLRCDQECMHPNTATPIICDDCVKEVRKARSARQALAEDAGDK